MVERAAGLAKDSRAKTRHAAVLVKDGSMMAWGTNGVPYPGEDHCYCKVAEFGVHDNCRTHAEQRAIGLARDGDGWKMLQGAKLIYVRLEADDVQFRLVSTIDEAVDAVRAGSANLEVLANYTAFQQYRTALGRVQ